MDEQDTICAVSTAPGEGGIGIIRLSGRDAISIVTNVFKQKKKKLLRSAATHTLHYGHIMNPLTGQIIDEALVAIMRAPATYTREDIVEINCHGGMMPLTRTLALLIATGARQAEPGEFTKRAFLNGRIDLAQAEAVMDIISSKTDMSLRAANEQLLGGLSQEIANLRDRLVSLLASVEASIDFPEEDIVIGLGLTLKQEVTRLRAQVSDLLSGFTYGKILREGFATAIVGRPNVGKSSLLNALLRQERAIVTEIPGTTRDVLEEYVNVFGVPLRILDTAGIRQSHDVIEQEGVRRSLAAIESADLIIVVLDGSQSLMPEDNRVVEEIHGKNAVAVINKSDLPRKLGKLDWPEIQIALSCRTKDGLDNLRSAIADVVKSGMVAPKEHSWAVNQRHKTALEQTNASLGKTLESIQTDLSPEFIALDLRDALDHLGLIIGATYTDDILNRIFNDFCIGK
ncbi:MAG TPA: tRNA uridine-5-carboxymethylaminomethyl(34) synthesis GTPase MnmE [Nitrospirota bacterium]|nr:tRNA uridine-5-carboxymethylaminomethyl(34) synthesis GTPase MnmE [Nitrospirota bacterium]